MDVTMFNRTDLELAYITCGHFDYVGYQEELRVACTLFRRTKWLASGFSMVLSQEREPSLDP